MASNQSTNISTKWQPKKLDLGLAALIAVLLPIIAGQLYGWTGALLPMLLYYGLAWGLVKWRRGSTGYFNPFPKQITIFFYINVSRYCEQPCMCLPGTKYLFRKQHDWHFGHCLDLGTSQCGHRTTALDLPFRSLGLISHETSSCLPSDWVNPICCLRWFDPHHVLGKVPDHSRTKSVVWRDFHPIDQCVRFPASGGMAEIQPHDTNLHPAFYAEPDSVNLDLLFHSSLSHSIIC